jgi:hypothetical protein
MRGEIIRFEDKNAAIVAANASKTICRPIEFVDGTPMAWGLTDASNMVVPQASGDEWRSYLRGFFHEGELSL